MSHTIFTKAPLLRSAVRRTASQPGRAAYHSASSPKMPPGSAPIHALLRQTTLRATAIAAQRTSLPATQQFSSQSNYTQYYQQRSRTPSPPPPYSTRSTTLLASPHGWTRFNASSSNSLSSVRTFTKSPKSSISTNGGMRWASSSAAVAGGLSPEAQSEVDEAIETITDLYGTAKDEFDIASEESEKNTTYAEDDRAAAREALDKLLGYYQEIVDGSNKEIGDEVRRRVGGRIRELRKAVEAMEEAATHGD